MIGDSIRMSATFRPFLTPYPLRMQNDDTVTSYYDVTVTNSDRIWSTLLNSLAQGQKKKDFSVIQL